MQRVLSLLACRGDRVPNAHTRRRVIQKWLMPITLGTRQRVFLFICSRPGDTPQMRLCCCERERWWDKFLLSLQMVSTFRYRHCSVVFWRRSPTSKHSSKRARPKMFSSDDWCNYSRTDKTLGSIKLIFSVFISPRQDIFRIEMGPKISILATTMTRQIIFFYMWRVFDSWEPQNALFLMLHARQK